MEDTRDPASWIRRLLPLALGISILVTAAQADGIRRLADGDPARTARYAHTLTWTGAEVIVVGGQRGEAPGSAVWYFDDSLAYDTKADAWRRLASYRAPTPRAWHSAVWTGMHVLVWGGRNGKKELEDGAAWSAARDSWQPLPLRGAPAPRVEHTAVWTGTDMIVWGGATDGEVRADGFAYDPGRRRWRTIAGDGAPSARRAHRAVWTGSEMIVWGGIDGSRPLNSGGRYDPKSDTWTPLPAEGAPTADGDPAVAWTGSELIVWSRGTGATWHPETNAWVPIPGEEAFGVRRDVGCVWCGTELLLWGGTARTGPQEEGAPSGAVYAPDTRAWRYLVGDHTNAGGPWSVGCRGSKLVWTGRTAFLMGGYSQVRPGRTVALGGAWRIDLSKPTITPR